MRIKGLDSLRVFSILIILIYHFFGNFMPAGFLGVNILFVMSGFLIMRNFLREIDRSGGIDIRTFYHKRFVRIMPAILLMVIIGLILVNFVNKDYMQGLARQVGATVSFTTNWFEIVNGGSYEAQFIKHIFLHTWFLSLEIHFYILIPIILIITPVVHRKLEHKGLTGASGVSIDMQYILKVLFIGLALISYATLYISVIRGAFSTAFNYFSDFTRMGSLFLGAAAGTYTSEKKISERIASYKNAAAECDSTSDGKWFKLNPMIALATLLIVTLILSFLLSYTDKKTYLMGFIVVDLLTVAAIVQCCFAEDLKEPKFISAISNYTYGVYIFHWPFLIMISSLTESPVKYPIIIVLTGLAVLFNQKIWEPIFRGEKIEINKIEIGELARKVVMLSSPFIIITLTVWVGFKAPKMLSLEKQIWEKSVSNDVQTISADRENLNKSISKVSDYRLATRSEKLIINMPADLHAKGSTTLIGDSVMLGPKSYLEENIPNLVVDAEGNRLLDSGAEVIENMAKQNELGEIIIIALGTNKIGDANECLKKILAAVPKGKKLVLVAPYNGRDNKTDVAEAMRKIAKKYKYVTLMDWQKYASENPDLYKGTDGIHFYGHMDTYAEYQGKLLKAINKAAESKAVK